MVILIMGVAGSGKTTVGQRLARELKWNFADADDFHPPANIAKMAAGHPLDDADRAPWLAAIRSYIANCIARHENAVVTCSALKKRYREILLLDPAEVRLACLQGSRDLLWSRLAARKEHFMRPEMLDSQLAELEPPANALTLDIALRPEELVAQIRSAFGV